MTARWLLSLMLLACRSTDSSSGLSSDMRCVDELNPASCNPACPRYDQFRASPSCSQVDLDCDFECEEWICGSDQRWACRAVSKSCNTCPAPSGNAASADLGPIPCGPFTCPSDQICVVFTPGTPPDAGHGDQYSCSALPQSCSGMTPSCGTQNPYQSGCLQALCQGEPNCSFDGTTLTCIGL